MLIAHVKKKHTFCLNDLLYMSPKCDQVTQAEVLWEVAVVSLTPPNISHKLLIGFSFSNTVL